jgi:hypothetical protein
MAQVHPGEADQAPVEVPERADPEWEEWAAQEQVRVRMENASVRNAARLYLMRLEFLALLSNVPNVGQRW